MEASLSHPWHLPFFSGDRARAALVAIAIHGALFAVGSFGLVRGLEYGMDASDGMSEVDLIAAPAPAVAMAAPPAATPAPAQPMPVMDEMDVAESLKNPVQPTPATATPAPNAILQTKDLNGPLGDGSSPVAGTDATTVHRAGSSGAYFKPGYYRNPPPPYPEESRRLKQQGRVLLEVHVTAAGKVASAKVKQSSGFPLLDESALRGVRNWKFRPATVGGLRVDILADIPIRFQLR